MTKSLLNEQVLITGDPERSLDKAYHTREDCKHLVRVKRTGRYFARVTLFEARRMGRDRECADCKGREQYGERGRECTR